MSLFFVSSQSFVIERRDDRNRASVVVLGSAVRDADERLRTRVFVVVVVVVRARRENLRAQPRELRLGFV